MFLALVFGPQVLLGLLHSPAWPTAPETLHNGEMGFNELEAELDLAATWAGALDVALLAALPSAPLSGLG